MAKTKRYPVEVRERAVRLVLEHREEYSSMWAAVTSIAQKVGCSPLTLQGWVRRAEVDGGVRPGTRTSDAERVRELERENRGLRRVETPASIRSSTTALNTSRLAKCS
jgi:transposase